MHEAWEKVMGNSRDMVCLMSKKNPNITHIL